MNNESLEKNINENVGDTSINISVELPEVSAQSAEYHDDEILANLDDGEESTELSDNENNENKNQENSPSSNTHEVELDAEREKVRGIKDDKNKGYDPSIHIFPPEKTPSGIWKKLPKSARKVSTEGKEILPTQTNASIRRSAEKVASLYDSVHMFAFGEDGKADDKQMIKLVESFDKYFQENGAIDLPPHLDLAMTCLNHTTEVFKRPSISERIKGKLAVWTVKRHLKKMFKSKQISKSQMVEAQSYLSQGIGAFNQWQEKMASRVEAEKNA